MNRSVPALFLFCAFVTCPSVAAAEPAGANNQELLGRRLFNQSCRVCHTHPTLLSPQYGPVLSMNTLGGSADAIRAIITGGTPRMPAFKYDFKPEQIDAIVAYIRTIPAPAAAVPVSGKAANAPGAD